VRQRATPPSLIAERPVPHHELALSRNVARPESVIRQLPQPGKGAKTERIPGAQEDAPVERRRLSYQSEYRDFLFRMRFMRGHMHFQRLPGHEDVIRHQQHDRCFSDFEPTILRIPGAVVRVMQVAHSKRQARDPFLDHCFRVVR